ncbi:MAG: hypothetical protein ACRCWG_03145 [Sarcina sp.]
MRSRLTEHMITLCVYSLMILIAATFIFSLDFTDKLKVVEDRTNYINEFID